MYDRSDLSARGIVYFMIALAITVFVIHLISWGMVRYFAGSREAAGAAQRRRHHALRAGQRERQSGAAVSGAATAAG